jgi:HTH-type transcriptional regulator/antitoxin HipB
MDYPVKTLSQLRPILQGFRKETGLTQAAMAEKLGITQQSYAQLEAKPASASVERLFKILRLLNVDIRLAYTASPQPKVKIAAKVVARHATTTGEPQPGKKKVGDKPRTPTRVSKAAAPARPRPVVATTKKKESW